MSFWKRWAWHAMIIAIVAQLLVVATNLGVGNGYNRNWLRIGSFTAQPSEVVKLALIIWLAWILTTKRHLLNDWKQVAAADRAGRRRGDPASSCSATTSAPRSSSSPWCSARCSTRACGCGSSPRRLAIIAVVGLDRRAVRATPGAAGSTSWLGGCTDPSLFSNEC